MKKRILVIIGSILIFVGVAGAISSAMAAGLFISREDYEKNYGSEMKNVEWTYEGALKSLNVETVSAQTIIRYSDSTKISVEYIAKTPGLFCETSFEDGRLQIEERSSLIVSLFTLYSENSVLTVTLPESCKNTAIEKASVSMASGSLSGDLPKSVDTDITITSGTADNITIDCENLQIGITSGYVQLTNRGGRIKQAELYSTSGTAVLNGFSADNSRFEQISGALTVNGASGNITIDKVSGHSVIDYSCFDGDLTVESVSGGTKIHLPEYSGFDLDFDSVSGFCNVDVSTKEADGIEKYKFSEAVEAHFGGEGGNNIVIDVVSGDTEITTFAD